LKVHRRCHLVLRKKINKMTTARWMSFARTFFYWGSRSFLCCQWTHYHTFIYTSTSSVQLSSFREFWSKYPKTNCTNNTFQFDTYRSRSMQCYIWWISNIFCSKVRLFHITNTREHSFFFLLIQCKGRRTERKHVALWNNTIRMKERLLISRILCSNFWNLDRQGFNTV
jgi:hypothetical protein